MKDVKQKPIMRTAKMIDKAAGIPRDTKAAFLRVRNKADDMEKDDSPGNYATDTVSKTTGDIVQRSTAHVNNRAKQILRKGKQVAQEKNKEEKRAEQDTHYSSYQGGKRYAGKSVGKTAEQAKEQAVKTPGQTARRYTTKKTAKNTVKTVRKTTKVASKNLKTSSRSAKSAVKTTKTVGKGTYRTVRVAAKSVALTAKTVAKTAAGTIKAIVMALKGLVVAIAAGGWIVLTIIIVIAALAYLLLSPFAILFNCGADHTSTLTEVIQTIDKEMTDKIAAIQNNAGNVDETVVSYEGSEDNTRINNWPDVLGVFSVRTNMDADNPMDVMVMDEARISKLREVFWDMTDITSRIEEVPAEDETGSSVTKVSYSLPSATPKHSNVKKVLTIDVNSKSYDEMISVYSFNEEQIKMLEELMKPEFQQMLAQLTGSTAFIALTPEKIQEILENLPEGLDVQRQTVVLKAYSLVGKVHYFWGGKSTVIGWDSRWGTPTKVTAPNSPTTGTIRPFGLDCSGYVTWVFVNACDNVDVASVIGNGSADQWSKTQPVTWEAAQPGDLTFFAVPGTRKVNHVGIVVGKDGDGDILVAHCSSSRNDVVVTKGWRTGFRYIRRPVLYD